jgi:hypothetical protein
LGLVLILFPLITRAAIQLWNRRSCAMLRARSSRRPGGICPSVPQSPITSPAFRALRSTTARLDSTRLDVSTPSTHQRLRRHSHPSLPITAGDSRNLASSTEPSHGRKGRRCAHRSLKPRQISMIAIGGAIRGHRATWSIRQNVLDSGICWSPIPTIVRLRTGWCQFLARDLRLIRQITPQLSWHRHRSPR